MSRTYNDELFSERPQPADAMKDAGVVGSEDTYTVEKSDAYRFKTDGGQAFPGRP